MISFYFILISNMDGSKFILAKVISKKTTNLQVSTIQMWHHLIISSYLWIVRTTRLPYNDQARSTGIIKRDTLQSVHQAVRTWSRHWFRPLTARGTQWTNNVKAHWFKHTSHSPVLNLKIKFLPDSAYIAGTTFSCALIEDNWELHFIPSLKLQTILHFFYMEE